MKPTRGLWLSTRSRQGGTEGEACLLVYDEEPFDDMLVSRDVKVVFESRPDTAHVYIAAPFVHPATVRAALTNGVAVRRAAPYLHGVCGKFALLEVVTSEPGSCRIVATSLLCSSESTIAGPSEDLSRNLQEGWLFDLFHRNEGLVEAPAGVHFKKGSGKHSDRFLRTANVLTSSAACSLLAMFCLAQFRTKQPRRMFVDTAPLISLAFATMRVARVQNIWHNEVPVRTFSSYEGLRNVGRLSGGDAIFISASTSGSLASEVVSMGARAEMIATAYYLASPDFIDRPAGVLCDLTLRAGQPYGYAPVHNHAAKGCPLCADGLLAADLEGDQFLLQRRQLKLIRIVKASQSADARSALELLTKRKLLQIALRPKYDQSIALTTCGDELLGHERIRSGLIRHLRRFCPMPLNLVVMVGVTEIATKALLTDAGLDGASASALTVDWSELGSVEPIARGGSLVVFGCLDDHARARYINATLRSVAPEGCVSYVAGLVLTDSPEQLRDLQRFLRWGEHGPETFTFVSVLELAFSSQSVYESSWDLELKLLNRLCQESDSPSEFRQRRDWLNKNADALSQLFLPGLAGELSINNDFVYLDTISDKALISQADIFTVVANALCAARCGNRGFRDKPLDDGRPIRWQQSVYGQVLLSPSNFLTYNDAILRAALLRAASKSELMYCVDEHCSADISQVVLAEVSRWRVGAGEALPEMLMALATRRMQLDARDSAQIKSACAGSGVPEYLQKLAAVIPD